VRRLDDLKLRNAIQYAIQGDIQMILKGKFEPHVLEALEKTLIMSITKALIEYDQLKSEEK